MADMATYLMLDDVNTALLEMHAGPANALAGYVNGRYRNFPEIAAKYGKSGKHLVSISVYNDGGADGAQCLDIEPGDATNAQAPAWFRATKAAGIKAGDLRYRPKLYTSESNLPALVAVMTRAGIKRSEYLLWSAHYSFKGGPARAHICGPASCGSAVAADATQWTDLYAGVSLDASLCYGYFFASGPPVPVAPAPKPTPAPVPAPAPKLPAYAVPSALKVAYSAVRLSWDAPAGAVAGKTSFHVQVEGAGGKVLYDESTPNTYLDVDRMTPGAEYLARVAAHADSSHESSPWSALLKFTV